MELIFMQIGIATFTYFFLLIVDSIINYIKKKIKEHRTKKELIELGKYINKLLNNK